jgi:hypothetical protein
MGAYLDGDFSIGPMNFFILQKSDFVLDKNFGS